MLLAPLEFTYNISVQISMKYSSFYSMYDEYLCVPACLSNSANICDINVQRADNFIQFSKWLLS